VKDIPGHDAPSRLRAKSTSEFPEFVFSGQLERKHQELRPWPGSRIAGALCWTLARGETCSCRTTAMSTVWAIDRLKRAQILGHVQRLWPAPANWIQGRQV
jgi:hypothetical protein